MHLLETLIIIIHNYTANCGPPSPPPNGFIFPYTSTLDGAVMNFTCQKSASNLEENFTAAICNKQGKWDLSFVPVHQVTYHFPYYQNREG